MPKKLSFIVSHAASTKAGKVFSIKLKSIFTPIFSTILLLIELINSKFLPNFLRCLGLVLFLFAILCLNFKHFEEDLRFFI